MYVLSSTTHYHLCYKSLSINYTVAFAVNILHWVYVEQTNLDVF